MLTLMYIAVTGRAQPTSVARQSPYKKTEVHLSVPYN